MADIRVKDLTEASIPGADYYLLTDSATDGVKKVKTTNVIAKADIGLGNVDNTSDATKNAATATLTNKTLTSPVINTPTGIVKSDVGLGNVDNTSDANKPVSTATQTALNLKANTASLATVATSGAYSDLSGAPALGALASKNTITVPTDITATGTPSSTTALFGDGSWQNIGSGTGDMVAADYIVVSRTDLAGLSTTGATICFLSEGARSGTFRWNSGDQSAKVAPRTLTCTANGTTDVITLAGHRLKTGDSFIFMSGTLGLSTNTRYYAIRLSSSTFYAATSFANAIAGTPVGVNDDTGAVLKIVPDWIQGEVVIPTGSNLDGSQGAWLRVKDLPGVYNAMHFGLEVGGSTDNSPVIRGLSHVAEEWGGGTILLPSGVIYMNDQVLARRKVYVRGTGKHSTILDWHASSSSYLINGIDDGTDGSFPYDRTMFSYSDLKIDGTNLGGATTIRGVGLTGNYRSPPILQRVWICQTTSQGIWFDGANWNIDFVDVEVDTCARVAGAGIQTNSAITDLNHVNFTRVRSEGCGNSSSPPTAGGWRLDFASAGPRGFQLTDCQSEGNFGGDEAYFNNVTGLYMNGFYVETNANGGTGVTARNGVEFTNCTGKISGQLYASATADIRKALRFNGSGRFIVESIDVGPAWSTSIETNDSSIVKYGYLSAVGGTVTLVNNGTSTITAM